MENTKVDLTKELIKELIWINRKLRNTTNDKEFIKDLRRARRNIENTIEYLRKYQ